MALLVMIVVLTLTMCAAIKTPPTTYVGILNRFDGCAFKTFWEQNAFIHSNKGLWTCIYILYYNYTFIQLYFNINVSSKSLESTVVCFIDQPATCSEKAGCVGSLPWRHVVSPCETTVPWRWIIMTSALTGWGWMIGGLGLDDWRWRRRSACDPKLPVN